jgi:transposase
MPQGSNFQKPYPPEFRREAVALYRSSGRSLKEIAHDLGVSSESLRLWAKQSAIDAGKRRASRARSVRSCAGFVARSRCSSRRGS